MTKEQKIEAYTMRLGGYSLQEVADKFGVTREYIRQITPPVGARAYQTSSYEKCVYPAISKWMGQNRYSFTRFGALVCVASPALRRWLNGETENIPKSGIDKILDATGMTYEEAFKK